MQTKITEETVYGMKTSDKQRLNLLYQKHRIKNWREAHLCSQTFAKDNYQLSMQEYIAEWNRQSEEKWLMTITDLAKDFYQKCEGEITKVEAYLWILELYWRRSVDGLQREERAIEWFQQKNVSCTWTSSEWDSRYAVDLVCDGNKYVQVKPISYLYWKKKNNHFDDKKHQLFKMEQGLEAYYIYEDNNGEFTKG